jgi:NADPH:quinone reductase-like Zn-dependent oxidoreductase
MRPAGPEVLRIEEVAVGEPGTNEIRIRVEAIGLNRAEALFRAGQYLEAPKLPARTGYEAAGIVDAVGSGVTEFRPGDAVSVIPSFSMNDYGVYGEQAIVPASAVVKTPSGISSVEAAALWMQYLTAYGALIDIGGLTAGDFADHPGRVQQCRPGSDSDRPDGRRHADRHHPHQRQEAGPARRRRPARHRHPGGGPGSGG